MMYENDIGTIKILDLYITFWSYCISRKKINPIRLGRPNPIEKFFLRYRNQSWSMMYETYEGPIKIWTCILTKFFYWFSRSEYTGKTKVNWNFASMREHLYFVNTTRKRTSRRVEWWVVGEKRMKTHWAISLWTFVSYTHNSPTSPGHLASTRQNRGFSRISQPKMILKRAWWGSTCSAQVGGHSGQQMVSIR